MSRALRRKVLRFGLGLLVVAVVLLAPIRPAEDLGEAATVATLDLSPFDASAPSRTVRLLFIHHSCGGQWLANVGPDEGDASVYVSAVNGGGLRARLEADGYEVHEASYGSLVGGRTDIFDWPRKFRDHMEAVLTCDRQDAFYEDGRRNEVVLFKSCFNNNRFVGAGEAPGDPEGPELTVENAKAAYRALLAEFAKHPDTLFVAVTAPPLALAAEPVWKVIARWVLRRPGVAASGPHAREFNDWLKDVDGGWLSTYEGTNVAVFDLYDVLTEHGASNFLRYESAPVGTDSHPNAEGNRAATEAFVPFLNRVVRRAGLVDHVAESPAGAGEAALPLRQED
ncbi:MAG: hypothetical protein ACYTG6_12560 [Planctomycetota bacterium]|jgi:hypothetical protein